MLESAVIVWVLIATSVGDGSNTRGNVAVLTQEFTRKERCVEAATDWVKAKTVRELIRTADCYPK